LGGLKNLRDFFSCVAESGSVEAIKYVLENPKMFDLLVHRRADGSVAFDDDALCAALLAGVAQSGSIVALKYVLQHPEMGAWARQQPFVNITHHAMNSGSVIAFQYATALDIQQQPYQPGMRVSVAMLKYLVETKGVDPRVQDRFGHTLFHYAVRNNSIEAVLYLHSLNQRLFCSRRQMNELRNDPEMKRILRLVDADLHPQREKIMNATRSLVAGAGVSLLSVGGYIIITKTAIACTLLLGICCAGAVGVLAIALMMSCVRNRRLGFFEPSPNRFGSYRHRFPSAPIVETEAAPRLS